MNILYSQSHLSLNYKVVFSILFILNPTVDIVCSCNCYYCVEFEKDIME